jgi:hypothetical protein
VFDSNAVGYTYVRGFPSGNSPIFSVRIITDFLKAGSCLAAPWFSPTLKKLSFCVFNGVFQPPTSIILVYPTGRRPAKGSRQYSTSHNEEYSDDIKPGSRCSSRCPLKSFLRIHDFSWARMNFYLFLSLSLYRKPPIKRVSLLQLS